MTTPAEKAPGDAAAHSPENLSARAAAVAAGLRRYNEWRRGSDVKPPNPVEVGELIDAAVEMLEGVSKR